MKWLSVTNYFFVFCQNPTAFIYNYFLLNMYFSIFFKIKQSAFFHKQKKNWNTRYRKGGMTMNSKLLDYTLLTLVIVGAVNWGLIGFFRFDLVAFLFGSMSWLSRIVYALVGIGGLYLLSAYGRIRSIDQA